MPSARGFATAVCLILLVLAVIAIFQRMKRGFESAQRSGVPVSQALLQGRRKRLAISGVITMFILAGLAVVALFTR